MAYLTDEVGNHLVDQFSINLLTTDDFPTTGVVATFEAPDIAVVVGQTTLVATMVLGDHVLDNGLIVLSTEANAFWLCSANPTGNYFTANGLRLASKSGVPFGAPEVILDGSSVVSFAILDGSGLANGLCTHWAAVDSVNSRVLAYGPLDHSAPISTGQAFRLPSFSIFVTAHE